MLCKTIKEFILFGTNIPIFLHSKLRYKKNKQ